MDSGKRYPSLHDHDDIEMESGESRSSIDHATSLRLHPSGYKLSKQEQSIPVNTSSFLKLVTTRLTSQ